MSEIYDSSLCLLKDAIINIEISTGQIFISIRALDVSKFYAFKYLLRSHMYFAQLFQPTIYRLVIISQDRSLLCISVFFAKNHPVPQSMVSSFFCLVIRFDKFCTFNSTIVQYFCANNIYWNHKTMFGNCENPKLIIRSIVRTKK